MNERKTENASRNGIWRLVLPAVIALSLAVSLVLAAASFYFRAERESVEELAGVGMEDVSRRVERGVRNLKSVREMSDGVAISRARSLAQLIAENPRVLDASSRALFDSYAEMLCVDELHVADASGRLVRSFPSVYEGRNMCDSAQSAAFLPAITNQAFELVQEPQGKGLSTGDTRFDRLFQYAGVARRDVPGIVQIGYRAERVAEAMQLADVSEIAGNTRIGRNGRVRIEKLVPTTPPVTGLRYEDGADGRTRAVYETDCEGYRIAVLMPVRKTCLAERSTLDALIVLIVLQVLLLVISFPTVRRTIADDCRELWRQLSIKADGTGAFLRVVLSPLALVSVLVFAVVLVMIWVVSLRTSRQQAEERLRAAAEDVIDEIDSCMDLQLAFVGRELCERYCSPEEMRKLDLARLARDYFVDEINVVDASGLCIASTVPEICGQDQWSLANPARFCQALIKDGNAVFSQPFRQSATEQTVFRKYVGVAFTGASRGYVQLGFDRARLQNSIDYQLKELAHNWHIGENGFFILSKARNGVILSTQHEAYEGETLAGLGFDVFAARAQQNVERRDPVSKKFLGFESVRYFVSSFGGDDCLCTSGVINQFHRYVAAIPLSEIYGPSRRIVGVTAVVLFAALAMVVVFLTNLSSLVKRLQGYIASEAEHRQKDLMLAQTVQVSSLPLVRNDPDGPCQIDALMDPAREVGGDFFDFYTTPSGKIFFLIADVSGKGIPAAMFMMKAKTTIRACVFESEDFASAIGRANTLLAENNEANMFVTAWFGLVDLKTGVVEYVNAGHNPPLVKRAGGSVEWVRGKRGLVLAAMAGAVYRVERLTLSPGDVLFLYTDGVTEAMDATGALFGEDRLESALVESDAGIIRFVRARVAEFVALAERSDDITMLSLRLSQLMNNERNENGH